MKELGEPLNGRVVFYRDLDVPSRLMKAVFLSYEQHLIWSKYRWRNQRIMLEESASGMCAIFRHIMNCQNYILIDPSSGVIFGGVLLVDGRC